MEGALCVIRVPPPFLTPSGPFLPEPFPFSCPPLLLGSTLSPDLGLVYVPKAKERAFGFITLCPSKWADCSEPATENKKSF